MKLSKFLQQNQSAILDDWYELVIHTYPEETSKFLKRVKDACDNPVGHATHQGLESVLKGLVENTGSETFKSALDPILRIRAVQSFTPADAVGFVYGLKKIIREKLGDALRENQTLKELLVFETKIDELALIAFEIYMECREKLYHIKATEDRNRTFRAFERAGLIAEAPNK